jgi:transcriptional regulator with XRE-family HTH domain
LGTIQAIEAGKNFEIESLIKIARALRTTPEEFFITVDERREFSAKYIILARKALAEPEEKPSK